MSVGVSVPASDVFSKIWTKSIPSAFVDKMRRFLFITVSLLIPNFTSLLVAIAPEMNSSSPTKSTDPSLASDGGRQNDRTTARPSVSETEILLVPVGGVGVGGAAAARSKGSASTALETRMRFNSAQIDVLSCSRLNWRLTESKSPEIVTSDPKSPANDRCTLPLSGSSTYCRSLVEADISSTASSSGLQ